MLNCAIPTDGFSAYLQQANAPVGRPGRSLAGPRNPAINLGRYVNNPAEDGG